MLAYDSTCDAAVDAIGPIFTGPPPPPSSAPVTEPWLMTPSFPPPTVSEAVSQTIRIASVVPPTATSEPPTVKVKPKAKPEPKPEPASVVPPTVKSPAPAPAQPAKRAGFSKLAIILVVLANAGLGAGLASLHRNEQRAREPVAKISSEVTTLQATQTETSARLDEQELKLTKTIERLDATEKRQAQAERAAKEHAEHEAKELAALSARVGNAERKVDFEVHRIDDALKIVDLAQPRATH